MTATQLLASPPPLLSDAAPLFERVVLGIDFGTASLAAARWAMNNVTREAHAILAHVIPHQRSTGYDAVELEPSRDDDPRRLLPTVVGGLGGFAVTLRAASTKSLVRIGRPSEWLSAVANGVEASLVVLGRRADARRRRMGEPNVLERVARRSGSAVLVVPEGTTEPPGHIVAAVDESRFARSILRVARWLAWLHRCPLTVLHVVSPTEGAYDRVIRDANNSRGRAAPRGDQATSLAATTASSAQVEVVVGDPAREVVAFASSFASPLLVIGQRGADHAPPGSLGSVARELLMRAPLPVIATSDRP